MKNVKKKQLVYKIKINKEEFEYGCLGKCEEKRLVGIQNINKKFEYGILLVLECDEGKWLLKSAQDQRIELVRLDAL